MQSDQQQSIQSEIYRDLYILMKMLVLCQAFLKTNFAK